MKFTTQQKEEILNCLESRRHTVLDDIESATEFESNIENLNVLETKIKANSSEYNADEIQWLKEEFESLSNIAADNLAYEKKKPFSVTSLPLAGNYSRSTTTALNKLK